jgi:hypothetical protein
MPGSPCFLLYRESNDECLLQWIGWSVTQLGDALDAASACVVEEPRNAAMKASKGGCIDDEYPSKMSQKIPCFATEKEHQWQDES